jgi:hypothetical protein
MAKGKKTGGRQPGSANKFTGELKDMILTALSDVGGVEYLKLQATQNATAFMTLVGKVLPVQMNATVRRIDLSRYSDAELAQLERLIEKARPENHDEAVH